MKSKKWIRIVLLSLIGVTAILAFGYSRGLVFHQATEAPVATAADMEEVEEVGTPTGDDPWKQMEQLVATYYAGNGVSYKGTLRLIDDNGDKEKTLEVHPFEYSYSKGNMWYALDSMEVIQQPEYILLADHRNRVITIGDGTGKAPSQPFDMSVFKKLMEEQKVHAEVTALNGQKILTVDSIPDLQVQGYQIYYDPETFTINKMLIGMLRLSPLDEESVPNQDKPAEDQEEGMVNTYTYYLEITYREGRALGSNKFDPATRFLKKTGNTTELQPAFAHYQLINTSGKEDIINQLPARQE